MSTIRSQRTSFLPLVAGLLLAPAALGAAGEPLVDLDAANLAKGPVTAWKNAGSLGGTFRDDGTHPQVKVIDGTRAVDFSGKDRMVAEVLAPATLTGDHAWTCVVRVWARDVSRERTLVSWANRPENCIEIEYAEAVLWGALGTWSPCTTGWEGAVPEPRRWHTLVHTYRGGKDGEFQAWCDGVRRVRKNFSLATKAGRPFVVGACMAEDPGPNTGYTHGIDGAIASVRIYDRAFTPLECWNVCGFSSPFPVSPEPGSRLEGLSASLEWAAGAPGAAAWDVYLGTDRADVEAASGGAGGTHLFRGRQDARKTAFGPVPLDLGKTYAWRIDAVDAAGGIARRGTVSTFSTETGNAGAPEPADGFIRVEVSAGVLRWKPGKHAVRQNLYFGTSAEAVAPGAKPSMEDLPSSAVSAPLPIPAPPPGTTCWWRVESINGDGLSASPGETWSFRTVLRKLPVYLVAGQSNAVGCCSVNGLPAGLRGFQQGAIAFVRGECRLGEYGWAWLRDGLGSSFGDYDGKGTFGPELGFGRAMAPGSPDRVIAVLKCAWGATNLGAQWRPPSAGGETGPLYKGFVEAVRLGLTRLDPAFEPELAGMIWMQGESDSGDEKMAADYGRNLTCLIGDLRSEFRKPDLPFVIAQISKAPAWDPRGETIREAERAVARTVPGAATFATDDYGMCDPWHYDAPGMVSLGERFAAAMKALEKGAGSR